MNVGFNRLYYGIAALIVFLVAFFSAQALTDAAANVVFYSSLDPNVRGPARSSTDAWELQYAKKEVAASAALVIVAFPIWWFHWRRWRALAETATPRLFRLYIYALMVITLVTLIYRGADALAKLFQVPLGLVSFDSGFLIWEVIKDAVRRALDALIAFAAWAYHARVSQQTERS